MITYCIYKYVCILIYLTASFTISDAILEIKLI